MGKIIIFDRLNAYYKQQKIKKAQKIRAKIRRKITALYQATYDFYLTLYLIDVIKNKKVDLPAFEYISGRAICSKAQRQALDALDENVFKFGIKKLNECYKSLLKHRQGILRGC